MTTQEDVSRWFVIVFSFFKSQIMQVSYLQLGPSLNYSNFNLNRIMWHQMIFMSKINK